MKLKQEVAFETKIFSDTYYTMNIEDEEVNSQKVDIHLVPETEASCSRDDMNSLDTLFGGLNDEYLLCFATASDSTQPYILALSDS